MSNSIQNKGQTVYSQVRKITRIWQLITRAYCTSLLQFPPSGVHRRGHIYSNFIPSFPILGSLKLFVLHPSSSAFDFTIAVGLYYLLPLSFSHGSDLAHSLQTTSYNQATSTASLCQCLLVPTSSNPTDRGTFFSPAF